MGLWDPSVLRAGMSSGKREGVGVLMVAAALGDAAVNGSGSLRARLNGLPW